MGSHSFVAVRATTDKMLYPALKWATSFPLGSHSEGLDLLQREAATRHLRAGSEFQEPFVPTGEQFGRMKREFFTPEPTFTRPTYYYPRRPESGFSATDAFYDISEPERYHRGYSIPPVNNYGANRPDRDIQYNSLAIRKNQMPQIHRSAGCSSSYADRSKYLPSTPKVRTQFPRFHTGFQY